ncbi:hypothetical protein ACFLS1_05570 [Verrucomicrobiota bacterium]
MRSFFKKRILKKVGLSFLSFLVLFLIAEIIIRKYFPTIPEGGHHKIFVQHHPVLGWSKKPDFAGKHVTSEYSITEQINSRGIRGPEYSYTKKTNERRIIILGDSFAEGYTVQFQDLFSEVLKKELNSTSSNITYETINMGTAGYSTDQELLCFTEEGKRYSPDITVILFYYNDVWLNNQTKYWRGQKPVFRYREGKLIAENIPAPPPEINTWSKIQGWIYEKFYVFRFIHDRSASIRKGVPENSDRHASNIPLTVTVLKKETNEKANEAWRITEGLLELFAKETDNAGSKLLVVYVPMREAIHSEDWRKTLKTYNIKEENWDVNLPLERVETICRNKNIPFCDLTQPFKEKALNSQTRLYYKIDRHWNKEGHALTGKVIAKKILQMGL